MTQNSAGVCVIKEEFVIQRDKANHEKDNSILGKHKLEDSPTLEASLNKVAKTEHNGKTKKRGQNKARPKAFQENNLSKPCPSIIDVKSVEELIPCTFKNCQYVHNALDYLKTKAKDIGDQCYVYDVRGRCPRGISCRFGSIHITPEGYNLVNDEKVKNIQQDTKNIIDKSVQYQLKGKKYDFTFAEKLVKALDSRNKPTKLTNENQDVTDDDKPDVEPTAIDKSQNDLKTEKKVFHSGAITDEDLIKLLPREKKIINWLDKLYLSPLTTVGNLPFRRICKEFGADITCGEMALCESLLKGVKSEWALVKRHESEDLFGAQICGNNAYTITKTAQLLQENFDLDFIDLNLGCPIDLVYKNGGGSGMMHRLPALRASVKCASTLLQIPFTVKMRTGVYNNKKIAHTIIPQLVECGSSLITLHGRSKEARYTKSSDWEYIEMCAKEAAPCPVFGNGDILNYLDYVEKRKLAPTVQGVMIGRGALIKPWIFTEIKEQRHWDISSKERFDIIKKYANYGLDHWGSDTQGVENTRRFLLEWLSFLYRYVPLGLLEKPPQKINERPPPYIGRDDLETLMASGNCADWIKITEMLLGPVPDGFNFLPKHKANSYL